MGNELRSCLVQLELAINRSQLLYPLVLRQLRISKCIKMSIYLTRVHCSWFHKGVPL